MYSSVGKTLFWVALRTFYTLKKIFVTLYLRHKEEKGDSQWWSFWLNYHQNQHFPITPTNIQIIEIKSVSWASDSCKPLCAHFPLSFYKSTCIYCVILTIELCCPPFPWFIGRKWKWKRANTGLFRIQPRAPPSGGGFSKFIFIANIFF